MHLDAGHKPLLTVGTTLSLQGRLQVPCLLPEGLGSPFRSVSSEIREKKRLGRSRALSPKGENWQWPMASALIHPSPALGEARGGRGCAELAEQENGCGRTQRSCCSRSQDGASGGTASLTQARTILPVPVLPGTGAAPARVGWWQCPTMGYCSPVIVVIYVQLLL